MKARRRRILVLLAAGGLLGIALEAWWILTPTPSLHTGPRVVEIPAHRGALEVARMLDDAGVIRSRSGFLLLTLMRGSIRSLKAGEYELPRGASTRTVVIMLEAGQVRQHLVVFREGSTVAELARQIAAERLANFEEVMRAAKDQRLLKMVDIRGDSVEGYLYPDSYQLVKGMTAEEILTRMVSRMRERVSQDILSQARARELGVHELLTLASIIEKEAVERSEMPLISAVFWNRLRLEMPLQADPTVQYAVGKERQRLTHDDLAVDSPFNTYRRAGLPPGPIASPSLAAIRAAVNPAPVAYLYFVKSDDRHHRFSVTLTDHKAAVARYRVVRDHISHGTLDPLGAKADAASAP
jgi:UPF0755 protein